MLFCHFAISYIHCLITEAIPQFQPDEHLERTECYKQDICQSQLRLVEGAMGATDGVDVDDVFILERAFPERPVYNSRRTMDAQTF